MREVTVVVWLPGNRQLLLREDQRGVFLINWKEHLPTKVDVHIPDESLLRPFDNQEDAVTEFEQWLVARH